MFEDYLFDAAYFLEKAIELKADEEIAKRYFRAAIFSSFGALEAYINFIGISLELSKGLQPFEVALLTDKRFEFNRKEFELTDKPDFKKLEDKLRFIIYKFVQSFDYDKEKCWASFKIYKKLRDSLMHSRNNEDEHSIEEYETSIKKGFSGIIELMNKISKGVFSKYLRKRILDLLP